MYIDPDGVTVRTLKDGGFLIEDDEFIELFRLDPNVDLQDLLRQVIAITNDYYKRGIQRGRNDLKDDFRRMMGVGKY